MSPARQERGEKMLRRWGYPGPAARHFLEHSKRLGRLRAAGDVDSREAKAERERLARSLLTSRRERS